MNAISPATGEGARESARWGVSFLVVCALHLAAAALISRTSIFVPPAPDIPPDTVLIDLDPVAPAAPAIAAPAPPQPPSPEPEIRKEEPPPPPVKAEVTLPKPPPPKPAPPRREKIVERPRQPLPPPVAAPAVPNAQPAATPSPKAQTAHTPSVDPMMTWEHKLLARLQGFVRYPRWAQLRHQDGIAYVRIVVDRSGNLVSSELQRSSGIPVLDDEAVAVVERAKPLPPPPPEVPGEKIVRVIPVRFILR